MRVDCTHSLCNSDGPADLLTHEEVAFITNCLANRGILARVNVPGSDRIHYQIIPEFPSAVNDD